MKESQVQLPQELHISSVSALHQELKAKHDEISRKRAEMFQKGTDSNFLPLEEVEKQLGRS